MPFEVPPDKPYGWYYRFDQRSDTMDGPFVSELAADRAARKKQRKRGGGSWESVIHGSPPHGDPEATKALVAQAESLRVGLAGNPIEILERGPMPRGVSAADLG